ncbi:FtsX-like permease family protein [Deferrisoma sp.]
MTTVVRAFLRYLPRRKTLSLLQVLGIAFGVASAVGMALSARAALGSLTRAVEFLSGKATHTLARPAGPLEETVLPRVARDPAVAALSPVIDRRVGLASGEIVRFLGVDPLLDRAFRPDLAPPEDAGFRFLTEPDTCLVDRATAGRLGLEPGGRLATARGDLTVLGTFPNPAGEPVVLVDLATAQELLGLRGVVDRVDLVLTDPEGFRARWGTGFRVEGAGERARTLREMLRAFRLNLEALSLMGLFVGVFLVYNTAMFAVVTRRRDAGVLRSLGVYRREVAGAFLVELGILGLAGGILGSALGFALSRGLTARVGEAVSQVYFFLRPQPPEWTWAGAAAGVVLGWGASLLGAAYPLRDLVTADPVAALRGRVPERGAARAARRAGWIGLGVAGVSGALFFPASVHVYAGFAGAFGLLVAASLEAGLLLKALGRPLEALAGRAAGLVGRVAVGNLRRSGGRAAVAVAAFGVALAMTVALSILVGSFRHTLVRWMTGQLTGALYVAPQAEIEVPAEFYDEVRRIPGVAGLDPYRNVRIRYGDATAFVTAVDARVLRRFARFDWLQGDDRAWDAVAGGGAIVSESFYRRFGVGRGGSVELQGAGGPVRLPVAGVFYDYTSEHGVVMMDRATYLRVFRDPTIDSLGVFLEPGDPRGPEALRRVRDLAAARGLPVLDQKALHDEILAVFDATFGVTRSMRWIAVAVAFLGIAGALTTLYLERQREFGILRALGFSTGQVAAMTLVEGLALGLLSFAQAAGAGTALGIVLIRVINLQSFHWTVFWKPDPGPYLAAFGVALAASAAAALYPMYRVWRTFPQMQIREE